MSLLLHNLRTASAHRTEAADAFEAMFSNRAGGIIKRAFHLMGLAEEEITRFKRRHRKHPAIAARVHSAFRLLSATDEMALCADEVYVHHATEILDRVVKEQDTRPGTTAEVMVALSVLSLKAPPSQNYACAYAKCFWEVMPDHRHIVQDVLTNEQWPHAADEIIAELRKKCARSDRR